MPRVMITCPSTNKPLPTGMRMDAAAFAASTMEDQAVHCTHCQMTHLWSKRDAHLEDEPSSGHA